MTPLGERPGRARGKRTFLMLAMAPGILSGYAAAAAIDTGDDDLKLRWDNTLKYSAARRTESAAGGLVARANFDDGDRNFKGLISSRVDLLSELDLTGQNFGARLSGAAWYDDVYRRRSADGSGGTFNPVSTTVGNFTAATADLHGKKAELLDAFVSAQASLGDMRASARAGRHAMLWGESLYFGTNGIAGTMAPIDVIKAQSVPNTQFKELIRPVQQVSGQLQINAELALGAFYQTRWEATRLPAAGSYFATGDILDVGGERILAGPSASGPAFYRGRDLAPPDNGQGGLQLRYSPEGSGVDLGFYAVRFHAKTPTVYIMPGVGVNRRPGQIGEYALDYAEGIRAFGVSANATVGKLNVGAEVSVRRNTPLVTPPVTVGAGADNDRNRADALGNSAHAQMSVLYSFSPNALTAESSLTGEIAWNRATSVTRNAAALDPSASRDALGWRATYEANFRQVAPGLDLSVPLGVSYFPHGRSSVIGNFGPDHGGDVNVGISGVYLDDWRFGISFTHFYGAADTVLRPSPVNPARNVNSFKQALGDRDFISLTLRTTF